MSILPGDSKKTPSPLFRGALFFGVITALLFSLSAFSLPPTPRGVQGPTGAQGPQGPQGVAGAVGPPGPAGAGVASDGGIYAAFMDAGAGDFTVLMENGTTIDTLIANAKLWIQDTATDLTPSDAGIGIRVTAVDGGFGVFNVSLWSQLVQGTIGAFGFLGAGAIDAGPTVVTTLNATTSSTSPLTLGAFAGFADVDAGLCVMVTADATTANIGALNVSGITTTTGVIEAQGGLDAGGKLVTASDFCSNTTSACLDTIAVTGGQWKQDSALDLTPIDAGIGITIAGASGFDAGVTFGSAANSAQGCIASYPGGGNYVGVWAVPCSSATASNFTFIGRTDGSATYINAGASTGQLIFSAGNSSTFAQVNASSNGLWEFEIPIQTILGAVVNSQIDLHGVGFLDGGIQVGGANGGAVATFGNGAFGNDGYVGFWTQPVGTSLTTTNYSFLSNGSNSVLNATTTSQFAINNSGVFGCNNTGICFTDTGIPLNIGQGGSFPLGFEANVNPPANAPLLTGSDTNGNLWTEIGSGIFELMGDGGTATTIMTAGSGPWYIIPESGAVKTHVNATDLKNGTNKVGGNWSQNGTITLNGGLPASVGTPLNDSNWFNQTSSSPANFSAGPFTVAIVAIPTTVSGSQIVMSTGILDVAGYYVQLSSGQLSIHTNTAGNTFSSGLTANSAVAGAINIIIVGMDASGHLYAQLNGGTTVSASGASIVASASNTDIGTYIGGAGQSWSGNVIEVMASTAVPSSGAFTTIYNTITSNLAATGTNFTGPVTVTNGMLSTSALDAGSAYFNGPVIIQNDGLSNAVDGMLSFGTGAAVLQYNTSLASPGFQVNSAFWSTGSLVSSNGLEVGFQGAFPYVVDANIASPAPGTLGVMNFTTTDQAGNTYNGLGGGATSHVRWEQDGGIVEMDLNGVGNLAVSSLDAGIAGEMYCGQADVAGEVGAGAVDSGVIYSRANVIAANGYEVTTNSSAAMQQLAANAGLTLQGHAAATGNAVILGNSANTTTTGETCQILNGGVFTGLEVASFGPQGNLFLDGGGQLTCGEVDAGMIVATSVNSGGQVGAPAMDGGFGVFSTLWSTLVLGTFGGFGAVDAGPGMFTSVDIGTATPANTTSATPKLWTQQNFSSAVMQGGFSLLAAGDNVQEYFPPGYIANANKSSLYNFSMVFSTGSAFSTVIEEICVDMVDAGTGRTGDYGIWSQDAGAFLAKTTITTGQYHHCSGGLNASVGVQELLTFYTVPESGSYTLAPGNVEVTVRYTAGN